MKPEKPRPTVRRRQLGVELRRLRDARGLTLAAAAELLERPESSLSKIENGKQSLPVRDLPFILDQYEVSDPSQRDRLMRLARRALQKREWWWDGYRDVVLGPFADFLRLEGDATTIGVFDGLRIPGLLQTHHYAAAVVEASRAWHTKDEMARFVELRMARQNEVLNRPDPPQLWYVIAEAVLMAGVGGDEAMARQLERLLDECEKPNVVVQVLPLRVGAHAGMDGPFSILGFSDLDPDIVVVESLTQTLYLEEGPELDDYRKAFDHVKSAALSPLRSRAAIQKILKELR